MDVQGKVTIITGAAGALGSTVARRFAEAGARLALVDIKPDALLEACGYLRDQYGARLFGNTDVTRSESVRQLVDLVLQDFGRVDVLLNIAGGWRGGTPVHETKPETFDFLMNLNAKSMFLMSGAVAPHMSAQGSGKIVSVAASIGLKARAGNSAYAASKAAVIRITEALSAELKDDGINVNCVLPSTIDTEANREMMPRSDHEKWVSPEALADVLLFLSSDASRAIHGAAIPVYGRVNV
ncbi:MAG: SDR family NAD(P)-dependent oxidoreductase [Aggregatilineales bacterium]